MSNNQSRLHKSFISIAGLLSGIILALGGITEASAANFTLTVNHAGVGSGTVHSSPGTDIACASGSCTKDYTQGTQVTLSATPNSGSSFAGWSGACSGYAGCTVSMAAPQSITATFVAQSLFTGFQAKVDYPTGAFLESVAAGDFNGDGKLDLVTANSVGSSISVLSGDGNGSFHPKVDIATGVNPRSITVGDFNGDGKTDLAVLDWNGNAISIMMGNGDGTFQARVGYPVGSLPDYITVGDLNGDGKLDLIVANYSSNTVSVLLGNGNGTFQTRVDYPAGGGPLSIAVGDFNADGKLDIAEVNESGNSVSVLLGNGNGTFQAKVDYSAVGVPSSVAAGDFNGDGKPDLVVANQIYAGTVSVFLGNGNGTFQAKVDYPVGGYPKSVVVGDINGDGRLDVAVSLTSGFLSVLLGNGNGTFQPKVDYPAGAMPSSIVAGDFNRDGKLDLAVANNSYYYVSVLLNTNHGAVATPGSLDFGSLVSGSTSAPQAVTISNTGNAGLNVSGISLAGSDPGQFSVTPGTCPSLTPTIAAGGSCTVTVSFAPIGVGAKSASLQISSSDLLNSPLSVSLSGAGIIFPVVQATPASLVFGNIISSASSTSRTVTISNVGTADMAVSGITLVGFNSVQFSVLPVTCVSLTPTIVTGGSCTVSVTFAPTSLGFKSATLRISSNDPATPILDVPLGGNGAAARTLTVGHAGDGSGTVHSFPGADIACAGGSCTHDYGQGTQVTLSAVPAGGSSFAGWSGACSGFTNCVVSMAAAHTVIATFAPQDPFTGFEPKADYATGNGPGSVAVGDFNGDGRADLAVLNNDNTVSVLLGNMYSTFQPKVDYPTGTRLGVPRPGSVLVGDFNGDGKQDLVVANDASNTLSVLLGNGDGTFQAKVDYPTGNTPWPVASGDFNGDGKLDLVVANRNSNTVSVLLGNGDGTVQDKVDFSVGASPTAVMLGDFNGDGMLDLSVANSASGTVSVLLGNGDGTFQSSLDYPTGDSNSIAVHDFNGDGKQDLAVSNLIAKTVSVLLGNGDGSFQARVDYPTGVNPASVTAGDFNGDGKPDLAVVNNISGNVSLLFGNGDGSFQAKVDYPTGVGPVSLAVADFNGDGKLDLVVADKTPNTVSVLLNAKRGAKVSTSLLNFSSLIGASSAAQTVTISNNGDSSLFVSGITLTGVAPGQFALTRGTCPSLTPTIAVGGSCAVNVTFSPTTAGDKSATLQIITNDPLASTLNVALAGAVIKAAATVTLGSLSQTYDGTAKAATATTTPAGLTVTFTYDGSATLPTNAGTYAVVGTIDDPNYQGSASGSLMIGKATATVTLGGLSQTYDSTPKPATATPTPAGLAVTCTYNGSATTPTNAGTYAVVCTISDTNYQGSASGSLVIGKGSASVTLESLNQTYDGTPKSATATTNPLGKTVTYTYDGSATVPTNAGTYTVVGTINDINYQGSSSGSLVIGKASASVTLESLSQTYDGTPKSATATTNPLGKTVTYTYDGSATAPTNAGTYAVVGTINEINYQGSASSSLVIGKVTATVTLGSLSQTYDGTPKSASATTNPAGLTVTYTYNGSATAPTGIGTYVVVGTISDANYQGNSSGSLVIDKAASSTSIVSGVNPAIPGQSVTFTATVSPITASGTVTFKDGAVVLGTGTLSGGTATFSTSLASGTHIITAVYLGDSTYSTSTSLPLSQVVKSATTVSVTSGSNPAQYGQGVMFTANVLPAAATGTVTFKDGPAALGSATIGGGAAIFYYTYPNPALTVGNHNITAVYNADATYAGSTSPVLLQVVNKATTSINVYSPVNPTVSGQPVTFTAFVRSAVPQFPNSAVPGGTVLFMDGGVGLGFGNLSNGTATFTTSAPLTVGVHSITAIYATGDANYSPSSTSPIFTQTVVSSLTSVVSSLNPSRNGQSVTLTATVNPPAATGTVTFKDGTTDIGTATLAGGTATFSTSTLAVGAHIITAVYNGDSSYSTSTSAAFTQTVQPVAVTLASDINPSKTGQKVTFTATVLPAEATGTVTFKDGSDDLATVPLTAGTAAFSSSDLGIRTHSITAVYSGDSSFNSATSPLLNQYVTTPSGASIGLYGKIITLLTVDPVTSSTIYAGTLGSGIESAKLYKSTDSGNSWTPIYTFPVQSIAIDPNAPSTIYMMSSGIAMKSVDGGVTWYNVNRTGMSTPYIYSLAIDQSTSPSTIYAGTYSGVYVSQETGTASNNVWTAFNPQLTGLSGHIKTLAVKPGALPLMPHLFAGTEGGLYVMNNADVSWTQPAMLTPGSTVSVLAYDANTDQPFGVVVYAGPEGGVHASNLKLNTRADGLSGIVVNAIAIASQSYPNPSIYFAGTNGQGVYRSTDGGQTWISSGLANLTVTSLAIDQVTPTTMYAGTAGQGVFKSTDGGVTWKQNSYTGLSLSSTQPVSGQPVTFTATVTGTASVPTGMVTFKDAGVSLGTATLDAAGKAEFVTSQLTVAVHEISVEYAGDADYLGSVSLPQTVTINPQLQATLMVSVIGDGTGTISSDPPGIDCSRNNTGVCSLPFTTGTILLHALPSPISFIGGWAGCTPLTPDTCEVLLGGDTTVGATFNPAPAVIGTTGYESLAIAYQFALNSQNSGATIKLLDTAQLLSQPDGLVITGKDILLSGGFTADYQTSSSLLPTILMGKVTVKGEGRLRVNNIKIKAP